jgi:hypothetical protein
MTEDKLYKIIKKAIEDSYINTDAPSNSTIEEYLHSIDWLLEKILEILEKNEES